MIKWILFDQARVQTYDVFSRNKFYSINGKEFSAKELESIFYIPEYRKFSIGEIEEKELISIFLKKNNIPLSIEDYIKIFKKGIEAIEGMNEILKFLSEKFILVTLINEGSEWANYKLDVSNFRKFFKTNIISGDIKLRKPDFEFYKKALETINANPEECLFIDDQEKNCEAAIKLGIKSIVFKNSEQLKKELAALSININ
jgi:HAD superfamily hydrolase (TIGR01509 family)